MGPMREAATGRKGDLKDIRAEDVPAISMVHFREALEAVRPTVSQADLDKYVKWNNAYGSFNRMS